MKLKTVTFREEVKLPGQFIDTTKFINLTDGKLKGQPCEAIFDEGFVRLITAKGERVVPVTNVVDMEPETPSRLLPPEKVVEAPKAKGRR